jgi:predicted aspartyl protease
VSIPLRDFKQLPGVQEHMLQSAGDESYNQPDTLLTARALSGTTKWAQELPSVPSTGVQPRLGGFNTLKLDATVQVLVNGMHSASTMVDTGAAFSSVSERFARQAGLLQQAVPSTTAYIVANGELATASLALEAATIVLDGSSYITRLMVTPNVSCDVLLGMDIQVAARATIVLPEGQLHLGGDTWRRRKLKLDLGKSRQHPNVDRGIYKAAARNFLSGVPYKSNVVKIPAPGGAKIVGGWNRSFRVTLRLRICSIFCRTCQ